MITLVVEDGQRKIKMEETRVDQLEADHLATSQRGKLPMSLQSCPEAIAGEDSPRQNGEIALRLVDGDAGSGMSPPPYKMPLLTMPRRM